MDDEDEMGGASWRRHGWRRTPTTSPSRFMGGAQIPFWFLLFSHSARAWEAAWRGYGGRGMLAGGGGFSNT